MNEIKKIVRARLFSLLPRLLRKAHPYEPFPLYKPKTKKEKVCWFFIVLRWKICKRFVSYKSSLNGATFKELCTVKKRAREK